MTKKAMQSTQSDNDSNDSIDEEDLIGGLIVHNDSSKQESNIRDASTSESSHLALCKEDTDSRLDTMVQHVNQNNDSDSNVSDIDINDKKAFHESYKMMFAKWEDVYNENVTLMTQVSNLLNDRAKLESGVIHYKSLLTDKDNQLLAMTTELKNTKKSLKMMSSGTQMLYHILSLGKSSLNHHGLGYQHGKDSNSQCVFVKASSQTTSPPIVKLPYLQKGKDVAHSSPVPQGKNNKFIPTCPFFHVKGHIRPNCFKLIKYMKKVMFFNYTHVKPRMTPRPKVEISENKLRTTWIRKTHYKSYVSFISLRTYTTDFWYFDSGCSRHMTGDINDLTNY